LYATKYIPLLHISQGYIISDTSRACCTLSTRSSTLSQQTLTQASAAVCAKARHNALL
jgi:hypothetical protein